MTKLGSSAFVFAAALAFAALPALAQTSSPPPASAPMAAPPAASSAPSGDMKGMKMEKPAKAKKSGGMKTAMAKSKMTCMDYAWGSQDEKDCEAGTKKPPMMMHGGGKKSM
jgi:hypothetical protein